MIPRVFTIETHTAGQPTRIVVGGLPPIPGDTMQAKRSFMQSHLDWVRQALMLEPRGHKDMFGAIVTPPVSTNSAFGVIFMDTQGYLNMCVHGTIGVVTAAWNLGWIAPENKEPVAIDTPAGTVQAELRKNSDESISVGVRNVAAFVATESVPLTDSKGRSFNATIAFGGSFFALINAADLGVDLSVSMLPALIQQGIEIRQLVNRIIKVQHPLVPEIRSVDLVEFYEVADDHTHGKNVVIFGDGQVDRSPCGTGTCAKLAHLYRLGHIGLGQPYQNTSILNTVFEGRVLEETEVGSFQAIKPIVFGEAHVIGSHQFLVNSTDPFRYGFRLGDAEH